MMVLLGLRAGWLLLVAMLVLVFYPPAAHAFSVVKRDCYFWLSLQVWFLWMLLRLAGPRPVPRLDPGRAGLLLPAAPLVALGVGQAFLAGTAGEVSPLLDLACGSGLLMVLLIETGLRDRRKIALVLTGAVALAAGYAVLDHARGPFIVWGVEFAGGASGSTFGNPLFLADGIVLVLPYAAARWLGAAGPGRWGWGLAGAVLVHALLAAQARGAWVAAAVALAALGTVLLRHRRELLARSRPVLLGAAAFVVLDAAVLSTANPLNPRGVNVIAHAATLAYPARQGRDGRFLLWETTARMAREAPVLGWGPGRLGAHFTRFQGGLLDLPRYRHLPYRMTGHGHNDALQLAAERGIAGLGLLAWLLAVWFRSFSSLGREEWPEYCLRAGMLCGVIGWLVEGLFNSPLHLAPSAQLLWVALALGWPSSRDVSSRDASSAEARPEGEEAVRHEKTGGRVPVAAALGMYLLLLFVLRPFARDILSEAYLQAGGFEHDRENYPLALSLRARAWQLALEDRRHQFHLGNTFVRLGEPARAEAAYRSDLRRNPFFASSWCNLGIVLLAQGRPGEAVEALENARRLAPRAAEVNAQLARALLETGRPAEAASRWEDAVAAGYRGELAESLPARLKKRPGAKMSQKPLTGNAAMID